MRDTVKFNAVQGIELLCIKTIYFLTLQCSAVQCSAVEGQQPPTRLTKSPKAEKNPCMFLSVSVRLSASVERFGVSRMRDFFFIFIFF